MSPREPFGRGPPGTAPGPYEVAVIAPGTGIGQALIPLLLADGHEVRAVAHSRASIDAVRARHGQTVEIVAADLERPDTVRPALDGADVVISLAHARYTLAVLNSLSSNTRRVLLTGSTRRFTKLPDEAADQVRAGEDELERFAARPDAPQALMLHPSLIYGAAGDRAVNRLRHLFARWPRFLPLIVPLPDGGRHTVQPVHVEDVARAFAAAVTARDAPGPPIVVAGPAPMPFREFAAQCAAAEGRLLMALPIPIALLTSVASMLAAIRVPLPVRSDELRRMAEDKAFNISALQQRLGVEPRRFAVPPASRWDIGPAAAERRQVQ